MNTQLRGLTIVMIFMFLSLMGFTTYIQFYNNTNLNNDPRNSRGLLEHFGEPRGNIYAGNKIIAKSSKINDTYKYLREYPKGEIYAPITGYFSYNYKSDRGLESSLDDVLSSNTNVLGFTRIKNLITGQTDRSPSVNTTLRPDLQEYSYSLLENEEAAAVVMDAKTGAILSMVSLPSYDPNQLSSHDFDSVASYYNKVANTPDSPMINKVTNDLYPVGSTYKILDSTVMLESGNYKPDTLLPSPKSYTIPNSTAKLENSIYPQCSQTSSVTFSFAIEYSCNNPFAISMVKLGEKAMISKMKDFGFGETINMDEKISGYPNSIIESPLPENLTPDRLSQAAIGSMDSKMTIMMNAFLSEAVANSGTIMKPYLVDSVLDESSKTIYLAHPEIFKEQVMNEKTASTLADMMVNSVPSYTKALSKAKKLKVCGKTGTKPLNSKDILSYFTGFAPKDDPKYIVSVMTKNSSNAAAYYALNILGKASGY